jgi:hypothetical protein
LRRGAFRPPTPSWTGAALAYYLTVLTIGPLLGSFITEPAAMTFSAMLLRERYLSRQAPNAFKYATLGVLFVNVSVGGTLTPYAAPPVLMVACRAGGCSRCCRAWIRPCSITARRR